ncbi:hypothetical protein QBA57_28820 [Streptomyces scabiei]|uniref:hypothetical protein n=1 Tax=Streptomyces scabiei TaxID=1930 RepID=UPI001B31959F|nr:MULTISPECIES: hypothetical protein [Streptomyces]MBP5883130.1 hypothetical protein [Streptomyces sp. LBUM 1487]MDX2628630.1 hypothetical protein [Streptomyces scabiei]MDX3162704.1 hypothetical protein [Streptomyces scabiei]
MCISVEYTPRAKLTEPWDAGRNRIILPVELSDQFALRALRCLLDQLGVEQPDLGALCWCGEPIRLLPRVPQQRRSGQVMTHGA